MFNKTVVVKPQFIDRSENKIICRLKENNISQTFQTLMLQYFTSDMQKTVQGPLRNRTDLNLIFKNTTYCI